MHLLAGISGKAQCVNKIICIQLKFSDFPSWKRRNLYYRDELFFDYLQAQGGTKYSILSLEEGKYLKKDNIHASLSAIPYFYPPGTI